MKNFLPKFLLVFIAVIALTLSLRGNIGNPKESELNNIEWKEDGPFELSPERGRFGLTYSLVEHHSPFFSLPLARFITPDLGYINERYVSLFAPGVSFLIAPGYIIGKYFGASQVGSFAVVSLFAVINVVLIYSIATSLGFGKISSFISSLIFIFGSPAFAYGVDLYQHHISTFLILLSLLLVVKFKNFWSLFFVWFLWASSIPIDYPNAILMLPIGFYAIYSLFDFSNNSKTIVINVKLARVFSIISIALPMTFFLWFNQMSYGNPFQFSGTVGSVGNIGGDGKPAQLDSYSLDTAKDYIKPDEQKKNALGFFEPRKMISGLQILIFSKDRGVLFFTPIMILAVFGISFLYKKNPKTAVLFLSVITANVLLYSMWGDPWGGWAFGSRYLIPSYAILAIFLAAFLDYLHKNILVLLIFFALGGYSLYVNTAGALSSSTNPPQVQILNLEKLSGRRELYSWDRNVEFLQNGDTKSFIYQTWVKDYVTPWQYFQIIAGSIIAMLVIATLALYFSKEGNRG
jgi:hypothetical protein